MKVEKMKKGFKKAGVLVLSTALALTMLAGCKKTTKTEKTDGTSDFTGEFVISAQEAKDKIGDENVIFVDGRGQDAAKKGTIEGAVVTDWQALSTCQEGKAGDESWGLVPEPEELSVRLSQLGIDQGKEIIVLGEPENGWGEDGRILWELREAGCEDVKIVDGGLSAMKDIGTEAKAKPTTPAPSDIVIDSLDATHDITTEELQENYDDYVIVDVRTKEEYDGAVLYDEAKGGHLPGAIHVPYTDLFQADGTLKDNETITKLFEDKGIEKSDRVVTYCTGGIRSAYAQIVLEMCGYENTYSYCQSYWRWAVVGEVE